MMQHFLSGLNQGYINEDQQQQQSSQSEWVNESQGSGKSQETDVRIQWADSKTVSATPGLEWI
jgi:hypothetical protein